MIDVVANEEVTYIVMRIGTIIIGSLVSLLTVGAGLYFRWLAKRMHLLEAIDAKTLTHVGVIQTDLLKYRSEIIERLGDVEQRLVFIESTTGSMDERGKPYSRRNSDQRRKEIKL